MKDMVRRFFKIEHLPDGTTHCTGEVEREDHYSVERSGDHAVIFTLNGVQSKPIKVVYDSGWSWRAQKTQIKTYKCIAELLDDLQSDFWNGYTYNMACYYCKA